MSNKIQINCNNTNRHLTSQNRSMWEQISYTTKELDKIELIAIDIESQIKNPCDKSDKALLMIKLEKIKKRINQLKISINDYYIILNYYSSRLASTTS